MDVLVGPCVVAAALLGLAGAQKVVDPTMTVGALRGLGLPASGWLVRAGSAAELALGTMAIVDGSRMLWVLVALSYAAFTVVVLAAMRKGTMIGSCGCFGREETPPHWTHVALNTILAVTAAGAVAQDLGSSADAMADHPGEALLVAALAALALYLLRAAYVELPRTLLAARQPAPR